MKELTVIDVSPVVYGGNYSTQFKNRSISGLPIAGVLNLFRYVIPALATGNSVLLAFDTKSFRKGISEGYKSGRPLDPAVEAQKAFLYECLQTIGFDCYRYNGAEADDIVHWAVEQNKNKFYKVHVVTNDLDLAHEVQPTVDLVVTRSDMISVYYNNFHLAAHPGENILFNTISAYKALCGCHSDKIKPFISKSGLTGKQLYNRFTEFIRKNCLITYEFTTDKISLLAFLQSQPDLTQEDLQEIAEKVILVYPSDCPGHEMKPNSREDIDEYKLKQLLTLIKDWSSLRCLKSPQVNVEQDLVKFLSDFGRKYTTGEFSVEHNLPVGTVQPASSEILDLEFLKSFDDEE